MNTTATLHSAYQHAAGKGDPAMTLHPLYQCTIPPTRDMGSFTTKCRASYLETKMENALWEYNSARAHDGLSPVKYLPPGATFTRVEEEGVK